MNHPLISVIIPVYNVEAYLSECIDSILNQSYKNIEVILVNDGSPDNCGLICDDYAKRDTRIVVIHKKNGGLSDARNAGLDACTGDFIYFIDSDDVAHPALLQTLYQGLFTFHCDVAVCDYEIFSDTQPIVGMQINHVDFVCYTNMQLLENFYEPKYGPQNVIFCNKLFRKEIWEKMRFKVGIKNEDEDLAFSFYLNKHVKKLCWTTSKLLFYRKRDDSITTSGISVEMVYNMVKIFEEREKILEDHNLLHLVTATRLNKAKLAMFYYFRSNDNKLKKIATENFCKLLSTKELGLRAKIFFLLKLLGVKYKSNHK